MVRLIRNDLMNLKFLGPGAYYCPNKEEIKSEIKLFKKFHPLLEFQEKGDYILVTPKK